MLYIFLDESGDLGFNMTKSRTSKFFIVTMVCTDQKRIADRIISRTFKSLPLSVRKSHSGVMHCIKEKDKTRELLFSLFAQTNGQIYSIILDKRNIYAKLKDEKHILYNLICNVLLNKIINN